MIIKQILKKIRTKKLKLKYSKYGNIDIKEVELPLSSNIDISTKANVKFGNIILNENVNLRIRDNASVEIGDETYFNNGCILTCRKHIKIGKRCSFGPNVMIFDNDHNIYSEDYRNNYICDDIIIGDDVWIGANVVILKGAKIGNHSVIAAGTVVKEDVPNDSIFYNHRTNKIKMIRKE